MPEQEVEIRDGTRVVIRPISAGDKQALASGFDRLSSESRYRRFFAPLSRLSGSELRYLTEVDHSNHEALIAFLPDAGGEAVGVARFVRSEEPTTAEVAVTVVDPWQGRGVATALLEQLIARARQEGIERFRALVLAQNVAAIEFFNQIAGGDATAAQSDGAVLELTIELPAKDSVQGTKLGRALRTAASGEVTINPWRLLKRRVHETAEHPVAGTAQDG